MPWHIKGGWAGSTAAACADGAAVGKGRCRMRLFHLSILAILSHGAEVIKAAPAWKEE